MKLETEDLLELRLYNALADLENEKLKNLELQDQNIRITQALIDERRKSGIPERARIADKLSAIEYKLESKYHVVPGTPIDAETGEIQTPPAQTTPSTPTATACPAAGFSSRDAGPSTTAKVGSTSPDPARTTVVTDAVDGVHEGG